MNKTNKLFSTRFSVSQTFSPLRFKWKTNVTRNTYINNIINIWFKYIINHLHGFKNEDQTYFTKRMQNWVKYFLDECKLSRMTGIACFKWVIIAVIYALWSPTVSMFCQCTWTMQEPRK